MNTPESRPIQSNPPQVNRIEERPDPLWVRGRCPECGEELVSNLFYVQGRGYLIEWKCWANQGDEPTCNYKLVL